MFLEVRGTVLTVLPTHPRPSPNLIIFIMAQSRRWSFTLNNYSDAEVEHLRELGTAVRYLVFGREVAPDTGTPHLQGFVIFESPKRLNACKLLVSNRAHVEPARASSEQNATYCKKENDFEEFGSLPGPAGKTNQFDELKAWVLNQHPRPTPAMVAAEFPSLFIRYGRIMEWIELITPTIVPVDGEYRPYQANLASLLEAPADSRKVNFVVDTVGNTGKSWFIRKWLSTHKDETQILSIGKRDDLAHAIDPSRKYFLFDLPRSGVEYLQYSVLEQLKDRFVFSPKYCSRTKVLEHQPHVVVFMNEAPDMNKLSADRYNIINWLSL